MEDLKAGSFRSGVRRKWVAAGLVVAALALSAGLLAALMDADDAQPASAADPSAEQITRTVRSLAEKHPLRSSLFGVWVDGRRLVTGALGTSQPGVPATVADHFRIGNVTQSFTVTLLLQLVDEGIVSLDDPLSNWLPDVPGADRVTLGMLARSTSGYADLVTTKQFEQHYEASPFRHWKFPELVDLAFKHPALFEPGTSWAFSDTNFLLLGEALRRIEGMPVAMLLRERILDPLGLDETEMRAGPHIPAPVMHAYTNERGRYEDSTGWSPSWARRFGNMTSTLGDLGRWANALGTGSVVSPESRGLQFGPQNVGLGPLTEQTYYAMGSVVSDGWIYNNPQVLGYNGVVAYSPSTKTAVVVFTTQGPRGDPLAAYASAIANRIGKLIDPKHPLDLAVCPRPPC